MIRPLGHRADAPGLPRHEGLHLGGLLYGTQSTPDEHDFYADAIRTLGYRFQRTQSCTGYATDGAAETHLALMGMPVARRSEVSLYDYGRILEQHPTPDAPPVLADGGAVLQWIMLALTDCGIALAADRIDDPATINDLPKLGEDESAQDFKLVGWSRIDVTGEERTLQVQNALAANIPVVYARQIDAAADLYTGGILGAPTGQIRGGHAEFLAGFSRSGGWYRGAGSWGQGYGEDGSTRFSEAALQAFLDVYVLNVRRLP